MSTVLILSIFSLVSALKVSDVNEYFSSQIIIWRVFLKTLKID